MAQDGRSRCWRDGRDLSVQDVAVLVEDGQAEPLVEDDTGHIPKGRPGESLTQGLREFAGAARD
jgi:hypothetical protein